MARNIERVAPQAAVQITAVGKRHLVLLFVIVGVVGHGRQRLEIGVEAQPADRRVETFDHLLRESLLPAAVGHAVHVDREQRLVDRYRPVPLVLLLGLQLAQHGEELVGKRQLDERAAHSLDIAQFEGLLRLDGSAAGLLDNRVVIDIARVGALDGVDRHVAVGGRVFVVEIEERLQRIADQRRIDRIAVTPVEHHARLGKRGGEGRARGAVEIERQNGQAAEVVHPQRIVGIDRRVVLVFALLHHQLLDVVQPRRRRLQRDGRRGGPRRRPVGEGEGEQRVVLVDAARLHGIETREEGRIGRAVAVAVVVLQIVVVENPVDAEALRLERVARIRGDAQEQLQRIEDRPVAVPVLAVGDRRPQILGHEPRLAYAEGVALGRTEIAVGEVGRLDGVAHEHPGFEAFADAVQAHLHLLVAGHEFVPQRIVDLRTAGKSQHSRHAQHQNGVEPLANASIILHRTYYNYRIPPPPAPDTPIPACRCGGHTPPGRHRPLPKRARCRRHSP